MSLQYRLGCHVKGHGNLNHFSLSYLVRPLFLSILQAPLNIFIDLFYFSRNICFSSTSLLTPFHLSTFASFFPQGIFVSLCAFVDFSPTIHSSFNSYTTSFVTTFPLQHNHPHTFPFYNITPNFPIVATLQHYSDL
jgi:hypothetical protein